MPDRKYDKPNDRNITLLDAKQRVIDLMANNQPLPDVGIYDEPVRYFKANEQWCKVIFGWLDWLEDVSGWKDAEDDNYPGIQAILIFEEGIPPPTLPSEGDCLNYLPSASFLDFYPQNPYNQPDYIPPDYLVPPFSVNTNLEYPEILGYQATDVLLNGAALNIDPINIITLNFPRIVISVKGSGEVEIDFLAILNGGYVVLKVGSMPNLADLIENQIIETGVRVIDLNNDGGALPNESDVVIAEEVFIDAEPDTITEIYCVFVPKLNDELTSILTFGGGIRAIQLCGFEGETGGAVLEDVRFNTETCTFEKRVGGVWSAIEGGDEWLMCVDGGGGMATKDDIRDGMYEAMNRLAAQIVSGRFTDIVVGPDGTVTDPTIDGGNIPDDDPATPIDETMASEMGAALSVLKQIERVLDRFDTYYGGVNGTPESTQIACENGMALLFPFDETGLDLAATAYYDYRMTNGYIAYNQTTTQQTRMFCDGYGLQAFGRVIVELTGWSAELQAVVATIVNALLPEFWTDAAAKGAAVPSTLYLDAPCTPIAPATVTIPFATGGDIPVNVWKADHRMLIEVEGLQTDIMGNIQDPFWFVEYSTGNRTFINVLVLQQGSGPVYPTANQVPYRSDHKYSVTLESTGPFPFATRLFKYGSMNATNSNTTPFILTVTDLGEG